MTLKTIAQLFDLSGKGAIVTGAAMGIGKAIAFRLAEAGAKVAVTDINVEGANQVVEQIKARGGQAQAIHANAGRASDANRVVQAVVETFGRLDILVNNAGIYPHSQALEISEEMWDGVLDINLKGVFFYSQASAKAMIKGGKGGKIVNLTSIEGLHPREDLAHYVAAKSGVAMLTKALALELGPHKILVNAVAPGWTKTPGTKAQVTALLATGKSGDELAEMSKSFMARLPLGRTAEPDDVAKVVLFLVSAAADYMTGSVVVVDGGYLLS